MVNSNSSGNDGSLSELAPLLAMIGGVEQEEVIEALWTDAAIGGTTTDRSGAQTVGTVEVLVIPPTAVDPKPRLRWKSNGVIIGSIEQLQRAAKRFLELSEDPTLRAAFEEAQGLIPEAEEQARKAQQQKAIGSIVENLG